MTFFRLLALGSCWLWALYAHAQAWDDYYDEGQAAFRQGKYADAGAWFEKALAPAQKAFDAQPTDEKLAKTLQQIVKVEPYNQRYDKAAAAAKKLAEVRLKQKGPASASYADALFLYGKMAMEARQADEARQALSEALDIFAKTHGTASAEYAEAQRALSALATQSPTPRYTDEDLRRRNQLVTEAEQRVAAKNHVEALHIWTQALEAESKISGRHSLSYGKLLGAKALAHHHLYQYDQADQHYTQALDLIEKASGSMQGDYLAILYNYALMQREKGDYEKALQSIEKYLQLARRYKGRQQADAESLFELIHLYTLMNRNQEADSLNQYLYALRKDLYGEQDPRTVKLLLTRGRILTQYGLYSKALQHFGSVLPNAKTVLKETSPDYTAGVFNFGTTWFLKGDFANAERWMKQGLALTEQNHGRASVEYAYASDVMSVFYMHYGQTDVAINFSAMALDILQKTTGKKNIDYARTLANYSTAQFRLTWPLIVAKPIEEKRRQLEPVARQMEEAKGIFEQTIGRRHPHYLMLLQNLAMLYRSMENHPQKVVDYAFDSWRLAESLYPGDATELAESIVLVSSLFMESDARTPDGQPYQDIALNGFLKAVSIYKANGQLSPSSINALYALAAHYARLNRYAEASQAFVASDQQVQAFMHEHFPYMSEVEREKFVRLFDQFTPIMTDFALRSGDPAAARILFNHQLMSKGLLLSTAGKVRAQVQQSGDKALGKLYDEWVEQKELLVKGYTLPAKERSRQGFNLSVTERRVEELEKQMAQKSDAFAGMLEQNQRVDWAKIQQRLKPGEAAVEIIRYEPPRSLDVQYVALIITAETRQSPRILALPKAADFEKKYIANYRSSIEADLEDEWSYQVFWQPIRDQLGAAKQVWFAPDGVYNQLSLNTLYNTEKQQYLLDETDIHLVSNLRDLQATVSRGSTARRSAVLFGRPAYARTETARQLARQKSEDRRRDLPPGLGLRNITVLQGGTFNDLPGTEREVLRIDSVLLRSGWRTQSFMADKATEEQIKTIENPTVLHIATHGFFMPDAVAQEAPPLRALGEMGGSSSRLETDPMLRSGILLAGVTDNMMQKTDKEREDGILTAYEAANLNLFQTDVVVLSACETGLGKVQNGEGVYGLQRAFKLAGAKTVMTSLWKVDDEATQELMSRFYAEWVRSGDRRQAHLAAQRSLRADPRYQHPRLWGAFVMVGE